ncbi:MAG: 50S ribosomal protein L6 [Deltaproteobacteria bacterium]|jgi:large subunit ribosomal protein L6|nr:50S ribosomal protein L6 [Deltaproteobacteria bacterium]
MSRIGKLPITVPKGVKIDWQAPVLKVAGGPVTLTRTIHRNIDLKVDGQTVSLTPRDNSQFSRSLWGLSRTLVSNMVVGVSAGFTKVLEVVGVGWRIEATEDKSGQTLKLSLGFSHPVDFKLPPLVKAQVDPKTYRITLTSPDKELLGLVAAKIRAYRKPEPYKGKGIKYEGEFIRRKVGKAGGK